MSPCFTSLFGQQKLTVTMKSSRFLQEACASINWLNIFPSNTCSLKMYNQISKPNFPEEAFWDHTPILKLLITTRNDPNSFGCGGDTLLTFATARGKMIAVQSLIDAGANVNLPNLRGQTPLSLAIQRTKFLTELTRILLETAKPKIEDLLVAIVS